MNVKSKVGLLRTGSSPDVAALVSHLRTILEWLGGMDTLFPKRGKILLKPNIGSISSPQEARNTDPRVIEGMIILLREFGVDEIIIAESSIVGIDTSLAFSAMGLDRLIGQYQVKFLDLKHEPTITKKVPDPLVVPSIQVSKVLDAVDTFINLPKLKTICAVPVSFGLKNLKGVIPDEEKKRFHRLGLSKALVDLGKVVKPHLTIIDGITASELYEPREVNLIVAGRDVIATDSVAAAAIGLSPGQIEYLRLAQGAGIGTADLHLIDIAGNSLAEAQVPLRMAPTQSEAFAELFPEVMIVDGSPCSGCTGVLYLSLKKAKDQGLLDKIPHLTIVLGPGAKELPVGDNVVCLGNCSKSCSGTHFLPGCPPIADEFTALLREAFL